MSFGEEVVRESKTVVAMETRRYIDHILTILEIYNKNS